MLLEILHGHGREVEELILHEQVLSTPFLGLIWRLTDVPHNALDLVQNLSSKKAHMLSLNVLSKCHLQQTQSHM